MEAKPSSLLSTKVTEALPTYQLFFVMFGVAGHTHHPQCYPTSHLTMFGSLAGKNNLHHPEAE